MLKRILFTVSICLFAFLNSNANIARTSSHDHHETAQEVFKLLNDQGKFVKKTNQQFYDVENKQFLASSNASIFNFFFKTLSMIMENEYEKLGLGISCMDTSSCLLFCHF